MLQKQEINELSLKAQWWVLRVHKLKLQPNLYFSLKCGCMKGNKTNAMYDSLELIPSFATLGHGKRVLRGFHEFHP
jgi:hypothetical protein